MGTMKFKIEKTKIVLLIVFLFSSESLLYGIEHGNGIEDSTYQKDVQVGIFAGYAISADITGAQGMHGTFWGSPTEVKVEGINIKQNWEIGINMRYYSKMNLGIQADLLYSKALFPDQEVTLGGFKIHQPKSDLNFFTISVGPGYRYKDEGIWRVLNPYGSFSISVLLGYASDVNFSPDYGKGGYSAITGIGFNIHLGAQYAVSNYIFSIEYRFEYLNSKVNYFRSFTEGLSFIKSSSYLLLGINYSL